MITSMQTKNTQITKSKLKVTFCDRTLWQNFLSILGIIGTAITLLSFFVTANDIGINTFILAAIFIAVVVAIFLYMWYAANHTNYAKLRINNTTVNVIVGDIWAQLQKSPDNRTGEISVLGVNDFYDIIVDNRIIAESSLHGQYIKKISNAGKLDQLNNVIENDPILNQSGNRKTITSRKVGRQTRYELGSVVEFESYVLAAFTKFDNDNKAWLTSEEYVCFWMRFWENIDRIYAGRTINIPLMGAGITRFKNGKPTKQELLEVMLWSMKISGFRNTYSAKQVNFIIYSPDAQEIDFYHIQHNRIFN